MRHSLAHTPAHTVRRGGREGRGGSQSNCSIFLRQIWALRNGKADTAVVVNKVDIDHLVWVWSLALHAFNVPLLGNVVQWLHA